MSPAVSKGLAGRPGARRVFFAAVVSVCAVLPLPGAHLAAAGEAEPAPQVSLREEGGTYFVSARFEVPQPVRVALAVLTDYEEIPRFMPEVRTSVVVDRSPGRLLVEQEAVSRFMLFSKTVHLVLDVTVRGDTIRFADRCGRSFSVYEGSWRMVETNGRTTISYELEAKPGFDVPEFILKRLLKRDAARMIEGLRREMAARPARDVASRQR